MSTPVLLLAVPLIAGVGAFLLRRWQLASVLTGIGTVIIMAIILATTVIETGVVESADGPFLSNTWVIVERSLVLDQLSRDALLIIYCGLALLFLLSLVLRQDSLFVPLILLAISPLAGTLMAASISTGAVFLFVAMVIVAILIQGKRAGSTLTSLRYLTLAVLVFPILLTIGWMSETSPDQFLTWMPFLLLVVFLILLFSFPFHIWVSPTISESKSLVPVVVFGLVQLVVVIFCFGLIVENPVVYGSARLLQLLRASGAATLILAIALILTAPSLSRLLGYLLVLDLGSTAVALGLGGKIGLELVSYLVLIRIISLLMAGFGLGMIRRQFASSTEGMCLAFNVETLARRSPIGLALTIYGGLSLAGMPLTPGFAGRWALLSLASVQYQWLAILIVIAVASGGIGLARMMLAKPTIDQEMVNPVAVESRSLRIVAAILLAVGAIFALISPLVLSLSQNLVNGL
jgi:formate hydrogenlyase subunit 3/multisubunit Na+/H+ antiporter MnhD subunit